MFQTNGQMFETNGGLKHLSTRSLNSRMTRFKRTSYDGKPNSKELHCKLFDKHTPDAIIKLWLIEGAVSLP